MEPFDPDILLFDCDAMKPVEENNIDDIVCFDRLSYFEIAIELLRRFLTIEGEGLNGELRAKRMGRYIKEVKPSRLKQIDLEVFKILNVPIDESLGFLRWMEKCMF